MPEMPRMHSYEPARGHGLKHDPFNAIVGPRPIGWISSRAADGKLNLAPYSFFNAFFYEPPIIGFSSVGFKDTVRNVEATRDFVWNLVTRDIAAAMNATSAALEHGDSEFAAASLTPGGEPDRRRAPRRRGPSGDGVQADRRDPPPHRRRRGGRRLARAR